MKTCQCGKPVPSYRQASDHCSAKCVEAELRLRQQYPLVTVAVVERLRPDPALTRPGDFFHD